LGLIKEVDLDLYEDMLAVNKLEDDLNKNDSDVESILD
jgi:hypothetical protein